MHQLVKVYESFKKLHSLIKCKKNELGTNEWTDHDKTSNATKATRSIKQLAKTKGKERI